MSEVKNARVYARVSCKKQSERGISMEQQIEDIKNYCKENHIHILAFYRDDSYSGKDADRPDFNRLLSEIQDGELFVVWDLSRFSRSAGFAITIAERLYERNIRLVSTQEEVDLSTAFGSEIFGQICLINQYERKKISERTSASLQYLSKTKQLRSRAMFGWKYIGREFDLVKVPEQQAVIEKIVEMYKQNMSLSGISCILNTEGFNSCLTLNKKPGAKKTKFLS